MRDAMTQVSLWWNADRGRLTDEDMEEQAFEVMSEYDAEHLEQIVFTLAALSSGLFYDLAVSLDQDPEEFFTRSAFAKYVLTNEFEQLKKNEGTS